MSSLLYKGGDNILVLTLGWFCPPARRGLLASVLKLKYFGFARKKTLKKTFVAKRRTSGISNSHNLIKLEQYDKLSVLLTVKRKNFLSKVTREVLFSEI